MKEHIHFVGVGGVGTGTLAVALARAGHRITGCDRALYDPMKSVLAEARVEVREGFLEQVPEGDLPDRVIIGNVIRAVNPEAQAWIRSGVPFISFPEAVRHYLIQDRKSVVCAGTHGKSTTTSWVAYLFQQLGEDPSYLIGGVPQDLEGGCRMGQGEVFVGEGDEYDSAFFDKGPKFLHYNPHYLILNNIEFDHADIYEDLDHVKRSFRKLLSLLPGNGLCVANYDDPVVMELVWETICPTESFGLQRGAMWRLGDVKEDQEGFHFDLLKKEKRFGRFSTPLLGEHNLCNLMTGIIVASHRGHSAEKIAEVVPNFRGVKRRQDVLEKTPVVLVDDFAHHPTEVGVTLAGVRRRFPDGKLWAFFEPRSATARGGHHQDQYPAAFSPADHVLLAEPYQGIGDDLTKRFDASQLVQALRDQGQTAKSYGEIDAMVSDFRQGVRSGDVVVVMSNGEFGKIQEKIRSALKSLA